MNMLITGGAGFIGINAAYYFLRKGWDVTIFDNFSRPGGRGNIEWLKGTTKKSVRIAEGDIRSDVQTLKHLTKKAQVILHLAGQVAVTTSVQYPREDFEINALGTFNILEAARLGGNQPIILYSSTNKVYGALPDIEVIEKKTRYAFKNLPYGISESQCLDFHSPYGCSKGTADQYVRDYSRIYHLPTVVFRQSCIYGPHQYGIEDQGWVAWFMIAFLQKKQITVYGNGKQVRDLLFIDDLMRAYDLALKNIAATRGQIYNIGGGSKNTISIWHEFKPMLEALFRKKVTAKFSKIRAGDQPIFISDIRKAERDFGWKPTISIDLGIEKLHGWISENI